MSHRSGSREKNIDFFSLYVCVIVEQQANASAGNDTFQEGIPQIYLLDRCTVCNPDSGRVLQLRASCTRQEIRLEASWLTHLEDFQSLRLAPFSPVNHVHVNDGTSF